MPNQYLRAFVIGSSFFVFIPYFIAVKSFDKKLVNYSYENYTLYAPIGLGLYNVLSLYIANKLNLTKRNRFFLISLLAPTLVVLTVYFLKAYNYTTIQQWFNHIWKLYLLYFIVFNFVVYYLDKHV
jgi:hypothetical protein